MLPYYSPNFGFKKLVLSFFQVDSEERCVDYYKKYTGKKYVLITASCRTALYLAYSALPRTGKVIISPLICTTAIEPILATKNQPLFSDISKYDMNLDVDKLPHSLPLDVFALQATYFGGQPLDMDLLLAYAKQHHLVLIEDCAQGFGSLYKGKNLGAFGDIACLSMAKTAYGISGGILATDNEQIYQQAKRIQESFSEISLKLEYYRLFRNCLDSYRMYKIANLLYDILLTVRPKKKGVDNCFDSCLVKPGRICQKVFAVQYRDYADLHQKRIDVAMRYREVLSSWYNGTNFHFSSTYKTNPTKIYFYKRTFTSKNDIAKLNKAGVEAKHLQQKYKCFYQNLVGELIYQNTSLLHCPIFMQMYDKIVSFPLFEKLKESNIEIIKHVLREDTNN